MAIPPSILPGESSWTGSLAGYSPRARRESDTPEQLSAHMVVVSSWMRLYIWDCISLAGNHEGGGGSVSGSRGACSLLSPL